MIARAEFGLTGRGLSCQQCGGRGGLCEGGEEDGGVSLDCGVGVETCSLALSERQGGASQLARGCGLQGLSLQAGQVDCSETREGWLVCYCGGQACNNRGRTEGQTSIELIINFYLRQYPVHPLIQTNHHHHHHNVHYNNYNYHHHDYYYHDNNNYDDNNDDNTKTGFILSYLRF